MNDSSLPAGREQERLLHGFMKIGRLIDERLDAALSGCGLSLPKLTVLTNLVHAGGSLPLGALSEKLGCVKSNVTQLTDRLEADKLVRRVADPSDRRSILATITDEGRRRCEDGEQALLRAQQELFGALALEDREALERLLAQVGHGRG
jgi:DNA-binding MarR family transcriptional regulator